VSVQTYLRSITFSSGVTVDVPQSGVLVLVGPNNTGKSAALREIHHHFSGQPRPPDQPFRVITAIDLAKEGDDEALREWLEQHSHAFTIRSSGERRYTRPGVQVMWNQAQSEWTIPNALGPSLAGVFSLPAYTEQRLHLIAGAGHWNPLEESPSSPLQILFARPELEEQISEIAHEAFGVRLHLSRFPGGPIDLYVGTPANDASATSISDEYIEEIRSMPLLHEQGDGMRSFVGIMLLRLAATYPIVLLDEPEAFLHPPQARLLGRKMGAGSHSTQIVMATHSTDTLVGLLGTGSTDVTVVRLTRQGDVNPVSVLPHDQLRRLWSDPLLASSNLLDGLFHRGVVLSEGDTDARYYSAVLDHDVGDGGHELFFTHCGGKARMATVIRALHALDVPVVAIADLDVLREEDRVRGIVEAIGRDWSAYQSDWRLVNGAVSSLSAAPAVVDAQEATEAAFEEAASLGPRLTREASEKIRTATKVEDGWAALKRSGTRAIPHGDPTAAIQRLLEALRGAGLFVVDVGEVEGWHADVPHKSSAWLDPVLSEERYKEPGPHHEFMGSVADWFGTARPE
jgi:hypothetical protein